MYAGTPTTSLTTGSKRTSTLSSTGSPNTVSTCMLLLG